MVNKENFIGYAKNPKNIFKIVNFSTRIIHPSLNKLKQIVVRFIRSSLKIILILPSIHKYTKYGEIFGHLFIFDPIYAR
jgi:hypothetical protein